MMRSNATILRMMAEKSPKSYARKIRRRNKLALKILEDMWSGKDKRSEVKLREGCPHCKDLYNCEICLWTKEALYGGNFACCCHVRFGNREYLDIYCISLTHHSITIINPCRNKNVYEQAKAFLQGHIDWTNKYAWGKQYKRGKQ